MAAIFKSSLQNLSPLLTSLKVEPMAKPKTSVKFFVNITKPKTKVLAVFGQKSQFKPKPHLDRMYLVVFDTAWKTFCVQHHFSKKKLEKPPLNLPEDLLHVFIFLIPPNPTYMESL